MTNVPPNRQHNGGLPPSGSSKSSSMNRLSSSTTTTTTPTHHRQQQHRKTKSFGIYDESWEPKIAKQIQERIHEAQLLQATTTTTTARIDSVDELHAAAAVSSPPTNNTTNTTATNENDNTIIKVELDPNVFATTTTTQGCLLPPSFMEEEEDDNKKKVVGTAAAAAAATDGCSDSDDGGGFVIGGFTDESVRSTSYGQFSSQMMMMMNNQNNSNSNAMAPAPLPTSISSSIPAVDRPYMIALCGIPGSGKAISALVLANLLEGQGIGTMVMPHLGYHYPLDYLRSHFSNPDDMIYRRGAPDTFDANAFVRDVLRVRGEYVLPEQSHHHHHNNNNMSSFVSLSKLAEKEPPKQIGIPGFDHAKGDPEANVHTFDRNHHKVVICEGMYLMHDADGWEALDGLFDLKIFIEESDTDIIMERLKIRNKVIPGYTPDEIVDRVDKVDRVNAEIVMKSKVRADIVVRNISKPIEQDERPEAPTALGLALSALDLSDYDKAEIAYKDHKDWTMDITSRPESNTNLLDYAPPTATMTGRSRSNSMVSMKSTKSEPPPPAASFLGTWEEPQAEIILKRMKERNSGNPQGEEESHLKRPYMVSISATPGSGKSVSAFMLANFLENAGYPTMICPHDGYHFPLDYLKTFPDAEDLVYRRGAPETFDPHALMRDLDRIRNGDEDIIKLPAFDHAKGDPEPDTHIFDRKRHKIVLCEGLYLLHDSDGWEGVKDYFDYCIFMHADIDICIERVKIRNQCIPGYTPEEIEIRCEEVDRVNALTVFRSKYRADAVVESAATKK